MATYFIMRDHVPQKVERENLDQDHISEHTRESVWCQDGAASEAPGRGSGGRHLEATLPFQESRKPHCHNTVTPREKTT